MIRLWFIQFALCLLCTISIFVINVSSAPAATEIEFKTCSKSDPNLSKCLKDEIQRMFPLLEKGFPKAGIPPIDPFDISFLNLTLGHGIVGLDLSLDHVKVHGISSLQIQELNVDIKKLDGDAKFSFSKSVILTGNYKAKGKIQAFPVNGAGKCEITLINPHFAIRDIEAAVQEKKGAKYLDLKSMKLTIEKIEKVKMNFDNFINGNDEISKNLNLFINENWKLLLDELKPAVEEIIMTIVKGVLDKALAKISMDDALNT